MTRELVALLDEQELGRVHQDSRGRLSFVYSDTWRASPEAHPLSLSMPLTQREHGHRVVGAFLGGLLPDNALILDRWARRFQVSAANPFALLTHLGEDCAGAVRFVRPERALEPPREGKGDVAWLDDAEVAMRLRQLARDASAWHGESGAGSFSLSGAAPKTAFFVEKERFGVPSGALPTTHVLKPGIGELAGHAENEHFCLLLARQAGLATATSRIALFEDQLALVVERFDRFKNARKVVRVHQEDLAQALSVPVAHKYQNDGGPGPRAIVELLRQHSQQAVQDVTSFLLALAYNFLIVGTDAHAKNFAILIGAGGWVRLAPLYDVTSDLPYLEPNEAKLAMGVGGTYRMREIGVQQWSKLARELGLDPDEVVAGVSSLARALPDQALDTLERCRRQGLHHSVLKRLVAGIRERCAAWLRVAAGA